MRAFFAPKFSRRWTAAIGVCVGCSIITSIGHGDEPLAEPVIAATVNGDPILVSEVEREMQVALGTREIDAGAKPYFQAKTLAQLIDRRLIIQWLRATDRGASDAEVDLEISRLEKQLQSRDITLADHLASRRITAPEMRRLLEWQIGWRKVLARYLTDQNLEKYFSDHRRDFDGTRMRVAHILFKVEGDNPSGVEQAVQRATKIRESIAAGTSSFEEAARSHSTAPTSGKGGDIGFIERHQPMHEAFSRAAFALNANEVSPPVVTPFGVHLVRCLEIEPGQRTWQDARDELTTAVTLYLFNWAAEKERPNAEIRFTKALPHFAPGSEELAE
ncbi:MAG: peptidylprolyl isomerase [Planctomycetota bacterium]|nr:peptidylprolyl isomerase [Planctomycetota bacterium]